MSGSNSSAPGSIASADALGLTVHSLPDPRLGGGTRRVRSGRLKMLLVLLACAAPVVASYVTYYLIRPQARTNYGTLVMPTRALPALPLHDLDGRAVAAASLKGQWLLIAVGPADCKADCDQRLFAQRQLRAMLGRDRDRLDKVWFITDDAEVPAPLRKVVDADAALHVLRVPSAALAAWLQPAPGQQLQDHFYVIDPMGEWMMRMPANADPTRVKRDLERLLRASASWDQAGRD